MGRPKRVSPDGIIFCTGCSTNKHISQFYQMRGAYFVQGDTVYGPPSAWCKECMKAYQKRRNAKLKGVTFIHEKSAMELEVEKANLELAKEGLMLGHQREDGTWTVEPLSED